MNDHVRANAKLDPCAFEAWLWRILARSNEDLAKAGCGRGGSTLDFLTRSARPRWSEDGPRLAKELPVKRGVSFVIEKHLPTTHLDAAALRPGDGRPDIDRFYSATDSTVSGSACCAIWPMRVDTLTTAEVTSSSPNSLLGNSKRNGKTQDKGRPANGRRKR